MLIRLDVTVLVDVIWTSDSHKIKKLQLKPVLSLLVIVLYVLPKEVCHRDMLDLLII